MEEFHCSRLTAYKNIIESEIKFMATSSKKNLIDHKESKLKQYNQVSECVVTNRHNKRMARIISSLTDLMLNELENDVKILEIDIKTQQLKNQLENIVNQ